ncbi:MAG: glycosyltransferase family 39 protein [Bacteroidota bacterium]
MKASYHKYAVLFVVGIIGLFFQFKTLNQFPQFKHNWAQSDRYALALGFVNNGGDFFHPETFIYNNQFPGGDFKTVRHATITSVDFPVHDYLVSWVMRLSGTQAPWCFRLYIFLYSLVGLFFLYKICTLFTTSFLVSISVVLFAMSSPVFLYYQAGFLPTIPSLANCFISLFFLFRFYKNEQNKDFYLAILFITVAALARLPFSIFLVAMMCIEIITLIKTRKIKFFIWVSFLAGIAFIGCYYFYNNHLRSVYGSLFLNYVMPARTIEELLEFIYATYTRWMLKYFTHIHYALLTVTGVFFVWNYLVKKIALTGLERKLLNLCLILFAGCMCYYLLMTFQFLDHDYYFLDTFYMPFVFLFLLFALKLFVIKNNSVLKVILIVIIISFVPAFVYAHFLQETEKKGLANGEKTTAENFENSDRLLDSLKIPADSKILTMAADGPNNPFILMKRKGFTVIYPDHDKITKALEWPYDYIVLENSRLISSIYPAYPAISSELLKIGGNNHISVYIRNKNHQEDNFDAFFNLDTKEVRYKQRISFDTIPGNCEGIDSLSSFAFSGQKSGFVNAKNEYGICTKIFSLSRLNMQSSVLKVQAQFACPDILKECLVCVSIKSAGKDVLFLSSDLSRFTINKDWSKHEVLFNIPKLDEKDYEMKIFIWNVGKNSLFYDDFETIIYQ